MIIDNNNNNNNFIKPMPKTNKNINPTAMPYNNKPIRPNMLTDDLPKTIDPLNNKEMSNQALSMLKQRYENGLISIEEFKRGCEKIKKNN